VFAALLGLLFIFGNLSVRLISDYQSLEVFGRVLIAIAVFAPLGFLMGTIFPMGMHITKTANFEFDITPWLWSLNGAASVLATTIALLISMSSGIQFAYWSGAASYAAAAICFFMMVRGVSLSE
jgi:hypothetical protein